MCEDWLGLKDKVAIVTGGASGIGFQIASELTKQGVKVVVADIVAENGKQENGIYQVYCDVTKKNSVEYLVNKTIEKYGTIDILVNNAGVNYPRLLVDYYGKRPEYELNENDFDKMVAINQKGTFLCAQAVAREMIRKKVGTIINITSECGQEGSLGQSCYAGTKAAIMAYTRSWAKELGKFGIRVVGVAPGIVEETGLRTDEYNEALAYTRGTSVENLSTDYSKSIPLGREGKLNEIADLIVYLASDRASYITGVTVNISGGKSRG